MSEREREQPQHLKNENQLAWPFVYRFAKSKGLRWDEGTDMGTGELLELIYRAATPEAAPSADDVLSIRCMFHRHVPQENTNAAGAECAVCMADAHVAAHSTPPEAAGRYEPWPPEIFSLNTSQRNFLNKIIPNAKFLTMGVTVEAAGRGDEIPVDISKHLIRAHEYLSHLLALRERGTPDWFSTFDMLTTNREIISRCGSRTPVGCDFCDNGRCTVSDGGELVGGSECLKRAEVLKKFPNATCEMLPDTMMAIWPNNGSDVHGCIGVGNSEDEAWENARDHVCGPLPAPPSGEQGYALSKRRRVQTAEDISVTMCASDYPGWSAVSEAGQVAPVEGERKNDDIYTSKGVRDRSNGPSVSLGSGDDLDRIESVTPGPQEGREE